MAKHSTFVVVWQNIVENFPYAFCRMAKHSTTIFQVLSNTKRRMAKPSTNYHFLKIVNCSKGICCVTFFSK